MQTNAETAAGLRERYADREVFIVATDNRAMTMTGEDGTVYHERPDHFWSPDAPDTEGSLRYQGSAFHGHGIRLKPSHVMHGGEWIPLYPTSRRGRKQ